MSSGRTCSYGGACKGWVAGLGEWRPLEVVHMALDKHLDGAEQWAVGYMDMELGAEIWESAGVELGGWDGPGRRGRGKGAEGGRGAVVLTAACVSMEPSLSLGHTVTRMQLTRITALRLDVWSPQREGTSLPSVPTPQTPPSSLPGPDKGCPPRQSSRRAPCPHTGHAGTGPRRGQV